uniref:Uncharacterized protein n=1 Tax=uncultured prokaryote TaxID=198431 RepID=A0A0H5Q4Y3_9ZZZZ|nr:hypothetical protein [uncultured prokaryote]
MAEYIVEVEQYISAHDAFIGTEYDELKDLTPVAFYAVVKTINPEYPQGGLQKQTIAVPMDMFHADLVGMDMKQFSVQDVIHKSRIGISIDHNYPFPSD